MPNVNPNAPTIVPGLAKPGQFPQWGVGGGTPGSSSGWKIVEATNESQRMSYLSQGYDLWFPSKSAAQNWLSQEENPYTSGNPPVPNPLSGLAAIGNSFSQLTQANTWLRLGGGVLGIILIAVGIARMTHAVPAATAIARKVGAVGLAAA